MSVESDVSTLGCPIRTPRLWVEQHVDQTQPGLSTAALGEIKHQLASLPRDGELRLGVTLDISFYPDALGGFAQRCGTDSTAILDSIASDLSNGIIFQNTDLDTRDGRHKAFLVGARWRVLVRPQSAKNSRATLLVIEHVQPQHIPIRQPAFCPDEVRFVPIWDERPCDLDDIALAYEACLRRLREAEAARRTLHSQLRQVHELRKSAFMASRRELGRGSPDEAIKTRADLHAAARVQYSALRVMMDLLKLRCEQGHRSYNGVIVAEPGGIKASAGDDDNLRVQIEGREAAAGIEEDVLIAIESGDGAPSQRARVLSVTKAGRAANVELDLPADSYKPGVMVRLEVLSRFGMWAHQRAIKDLLHNLPGFQIVSVE
jgi:hypothetical protein